MTVPRKRKKLDDAVDSAFGSTESKAETVKNMAAAAAETKPKKTTTQKSPRAKVDKAFEVVDKLDKNIQDQAIELRKVDVPAPLFGAEGIHIKFKVDMIDWAQLFTPGAKDSTKDNSVTFDFTIPYIWNLPIISDITKAIMREMGKMKVL